MRPTVIDIAREAGVSLATVDRVLNARPGVRAGTVALVQDAVARLGYVRDVEAANLARGRTYDVLVLLPRGGGGFVRALHGAVEEAARGAAGHRMSVAVERVASDDGHALAARLAACPDGTAGVALMAPETPLARDAVRGLRARGIPVATLGSDLPASDRDRFVGIDGRAAGRTAGLLMARFLRGPARVLALAPSMLLRDSIERRRGFDEVMADEAPEVEVLQTLETHGSAAVMSRVVGAVLGQGVTPGGIYLLGEGHGALAATLRGATFPERPVVIGHELTPDARAALLGGSLDAVVAQNVGHLARSALRVLRALADGRPVDAGQDSLRVEIVTRENLPPEA